MKNFYRLIILLLLLIDLNVKVAAQEKLPINSSFTTQIIDQLLNQKTGEAIELSLSSGIVFSGIMVSNELKFGTMHVCIARSNENKNILLQFFKRVNEDKSVVYGGKLMTESAIYFLQPGTEGKMTMQKKNMHEVMQDCTSH